jgi:hypothetical protein
MHALRGKEHVDVTYRGDALSNLIVRILRHYGCRKLDDAKGKGDQAI